MRTVTLTERRSTLVRLRRVDVAELIVDFARVVEVVPTLRRGCYKVTARGYVGSFQTANRRWIIVPKIAATVFQNFIPLHHSASQGNASNTSVAWYSQLVNLIAERLRSLLESQIAAGLIRDYVQQETESATIRGRIDIPRQVRDTTPATRFHLITDEFTTDVIWNQVPKAAATRLLASPFLNDEARVRLQACLQAFTGVSPLTGGLSNLQFTARTAPYRELIELSTTILNRGGTRCDSGSFLLNLEQLFQTYITQQLSRPGVLPSDWSVDSEPELALHSPHAATLSLRPDLVIHNADGKPSSVWDVKWKSLRKSGPSAEDVHQVLCYAALTGTNCAGLIYPGRRFTHTIYQRAGCPITLHIMRVPITSSSEKCERAIRRLGLLMRTDSGNPNGNNS